MFELHVSMLIFFTFLFGESQFSAASPLVGNAIPAKPGEYLFVVSIGGKNWASLEDPYGHRCGGALIKSNFVLTAAHCYMDKNETLDDYWVCAESTNLSDCRKVGLKNWQTFRQWIARLRKESKFFQNDVALIELNEHVNAPVIAKISRKSPMKWIGNDVITASWMISDSATSSLMQKAQLRVLSKSDCINNFNVTREEGKKILKQLEENIICTNHTPYVTLHNGDSGSPIFVKQSDDVYKIIGINSQSKGRRKSSPRSDEQNLHVSVHYYQKFIGSVTGLKF